MSEVDEFERRVKRRIVGEPRQNQIIAKANRNCISFDVLDESLDSDLAGELDIGIEEVQRLPGFQARIFLQQRPPSPTMSLASNARATAARTAHIRRSFVSSC